MQQQATLWVVEVQGLGAVFTAAGLVPVPEVVRIRPRRREGLGGTGGRLLGKDTRGQPDCIWDNGVAALQEMPVGGVGGFRRRGGAAGQGGGGAGGGEVC